MTIIAASITFNEYAWDDEGPWEADVYDNQGRLILVSPPKVPDIYNCPTFHSKREAMTRLRECYPDIVSVEQLETLYRADGWHYPGINDVYTPYLCNFCKGAITLKPESRRAGYNAPYGALINIHYVCSSCHAQYIESRQEVQYGWIIYWRARQDLEGKFEECDQPAKLAPVNSFGFEERYLVPTKKKESHQEKD